ncbi:MAG: PDZ domain-containing protein [Chloroflexi bacterium]|nr:PDZ domain-containing protein [Chloroflexota bacterium]
MSATSQGNQRTYVIVAVIVVVGVLLSLCAGALAGGTVAYLVMRSAPRPAAVPMPEPGERTPMIPFPRPFSPSGPGGALIQKVHPDTPADEAGLRPGDLIIAVDGQPIDQEHPLNELIGSRKPGERVEITILRGGRRMTIGLALGEHPDDPNRAFLGVEFIPIFVTPPQGEGD